MQLASVQGGDFNWANPSIFSRKFSKLQLQEMRGLHAQKQIKWDLEHADVDPHMEEARLIAYDEGRGGVCMNGHVLESFMHPRQIVQIRRRPKAASMNSGLNMSYLYQTTCQKTLGPIAGTKLALTLAAWGIGAHGDSTRQQLSRGLFLSFSSMSIQSSIEIVAYILFLHPNLHCVAILRHIQTA
ncbi:hypothetical protein PCH_Pc22g25360 [Penicillium rubens Wisconsin 54-1255]|uniref:Uncharacterized protein n=1 Tax=Penicillium rubens (strain ATCC 28089 / DSM 1075 / NRRL 1951 / Wisconsin 54-1255) TaxID=500485 RepID=B6HS56_PENRW|nr:hypothetical protein PCH_Pc22g25360 [Penicillium rubens Wisconsin 54-1255]